MIARIKGCVARLQRFFNRHEWAVRLMRLKRCEEPSPGFGLVIVQIDGLSLTQFNHAMQKGRLPFLRSLLRKEKYVAHPFYSGLPSNTPAVQGELFYGVKNCVPAFNFFDRETGKTMRMFDSSSAEIIEARLKEKSEGLLKGGSSYSNIFTGGAEEAHFCASKVGWGSLGHAVNPLIFPFLIICYFDIFVRTLALMILEFFIALYDCIRGTIKGKLFMKEFEFIVARVFACVLLRELIVAGACLDITRGLPVIHLNFIGYDEQSHRRGPSSLFAHWCLCGIDDSIRRIWNRVGTSGLRDYDVWVYSDHGQEKTSSYTQKNGCSFREAVQKMAGEKPLRPDLKSSDRFHGTSIWRAGLLHPKIMPKWNVNGFSPGNSSDRVMVTAMGPLGHIYLPDPLKEKDIAIFAERLVKEVKAPLVLVPGSEREVFAWTEKGSFVLPEDSRKILGEDHPFFDEASSDLIELCHHPNAGNFVVAGWAKGLEPSTFPIENGAHAGLGPEETRGFALLPMDVPPHPITKKYLRPVDIYQAARQFLDNGGNSYFINRKKHVTAPSGTFRMMTYNVHGCLGMDGKLSTDRIARVISRHKPDVIALQELDLGRTRSGEIDQSERIARKLEMAFHFHSTFRLKEGHYGNAILSRYPMALVKTGELPRLRQTKDCEPRGAMWVAVELGGIRVQIINTHLSLWPGERQMQAESLVGREWLMRPDCLKPVVLCGDFNAAPGSYIYKRFRSFLKDSQLVNSGNAPYHTWYASRPVQRIDHVFVSEDLSVTSVLVPNAYLDRMASDHLPLLVELKWNNREIPEESNIKKN